MIVRIKEIKELHSNFRKHDTCFLNQVKNHKERKSVKNGWFKTCDKTIRKKKEKTSTQEMQRKKIEF